MENILIDPSKERKLADFRTLGMQDVMTLGRYQYAHAHHPLPRHTHGDMFEICYLDEGVQPYRVEGEELVLRGGDVLVTRPNEKHGTGPSPENRGRLYWLLIRAPSLRERFLNMPAAEGRELIDTLQSLSPRHFKGAPNLKVCLENMFHAYDQQDVPFRTMEIRNWALRFLLDVIKHAREQTAGPSARIQAALTFIAAHLEGPWLSLADIAEHAGLSLSRFKARFKEEVGIAPGNYVTMSRIEEAQRLLRQPGLSVTHIAMRLGFSTSQYFSTAFKRYTGVRPSEFRATLAPKEKESTTRPPGLAAPRTRRET